MYFWALDLTLSIVNVLRTHLLGRPSIRIEGPRLLSVQEADFEVRRLIARVMNETTVAPVVPQVPTILQQTSQHLGMIISNLILTCQQRNNRPVDVVGTASENVSVHYSVLEAVLFAKKIEPGGLLK
jgi:hypothetical protein